MNSPLPIPEALVSFCLERAIIHPRFLILFALVIIALALVPGAPVDAASFTYSTDWMGNSISGTNNAHVPNGINAIAVTAAGTTYANCWYDEAGGEVSEFNSNGAWVNFTGYLHGFGRSGGYAIAVNNTYVYVGVSQAENGDNPITSGTNAGQPLNNGNGLAQVPVDNTGAPNYSSVSGNCWYCIRRYTLAGATSAIPTYGYGSDASMVIVSTTENDSQINATNNPDAASIGTGGPVMGLAANNSYVWASDYANSKVHVYNASTMAPVATWTIPYPGKMTLDSGNGILWVVQNANSNTASSIVGYDATVPGSATPKGGLISCGTGKQVGAPNALAVDSSHRLLVADNGVYPHLLTGGTSAPFVTYPNPDVAQIAVYITGTSTGSNPAYSYNFGTSVFSGSTPGKVTPMSFHGISGLAVDGSGNFYVACVGDPHDVGTGTYLRKFSSDSANASLVWQLTGLQFVGGGSLDPANPNQFYSSYSGYSMNWNGSMVSGTGTGTVATWNMDLFNPGLYPTDQPTADVTSHWLLPGNAGSNAPVNENHPMVFEVRDIGGKPFLFTDAMNMGNLFGVMRMNGNVAVPACLIGYNRGGWPSDVPANKTYYWNDANGDGCMQSSEFVTGVNPFNITLCGKWVDDNANLWTVGRPTSGSTYGMVTEVPLTGTNAFGVPQYNINAPISVWVTGSNNVTTDTDWTGLVQLAYLPTVDTMILAGNTSSHNSGATNVFNVVRAYPHWSTATPSNKIGRAWEADGTLWKGLYAVGSYVFASQGVNNVNAISMYSLNNGALIGTFTPNGISPTGLNDEDNPISARVLPDGTYVIFQENDLTNNLVIYHWSPTGSSAGLFSTTGIMNSNSHSEIQATSSGTPNQTDLAAFSSNVATAFGTGMGGVVQITSPGPGLTSSPSMMVGYGGSKMVEIGLTASSTLSIAPLAPSSGVTGGTNCLSAPVSGTSMNDLTFALGPITNGAINEQVTTFAFTYLTETALDNVTLTATALFSDNTTAVATRVVNSSQIPTNDTFFGFVAPSGTWIVSVSLVSNSTVPATTNLTDIGFITSVVSPTCHTTGLFDPNGHTLIQATSGTNAGQTSQSAFATNVANAYAGNMGGVTNFDAPGDILTSTPAILARYGTSQSTVTGKTLTLGLTGSSAIAAAPLAPPSGTSGTTNCLSAPNSGANMGDITFTIGAITNGLPNEHVTSLAFSYLTQTALNGINVTVTATFSDNSSSTATASNIQRNTTSPVYDTFYGFSAPPGLWITSVSLVSNTSRGGTTNLDDVSFITQTFVNPAAITISASQINLSWTNNPATLTGFQIDRAIDANFTQSVVTSGTISPVTTSYNDTGLIPGTTYYYRVRALTGGTPMISGTVAATTWTPIQAWRQQYFGTINNSGVAADGTDYSNDGIPNLLAFALNLNPTVKNTGKLPVAGITNSYLTLNFRKPESATNITYHVQASPDLKTWNDISIPSNTIASGTDTDGTPVVTVRSNVTLSGTSRQFMRLLITDP